MSDEDDKREVIEVAAQRIQTHEGYGDYYTDKETVHQMGVTGEQAFARCFGLPLDKTVRPNGDNGADFTVYIGKRWLTIDIKSARLPYNLLVKKPDIWRCADILVLCHVDRGLATLIGWEHKAMMQLQPIADFGYGPNYFRPREELRSMGQLCNLLARRER